MVSVISVAILNPPLKPSKVDVSVLIKSKYIGSWDIYDTLKIM